MKMIFSRRLAIAIGLALLLSETLRLWRGGPVAWGFDHYVMGAILLGGVWMSRRYDRRGTRYLVAAWAFTCGVEYMNIVRHIQAIHASSAGQIPRAWTLIIGLGYLLCLLGLASSLWVPPKDATNDNQPPAPTSPPTRPAGGRP